MFRGFALGVLSLAALPAALPGAGVTVWNLELQRGKSAPTNVTVLNRCHAVHSFEVKGDANAPWLSFPGVGTVSPAPGASIAVDAFVDARDLRPGEHRAQITVHCQDCGQEPGCTQDRDLIDTRLKVLWSEEDLRSFDEGPVMAGEVLAVVETGADDKTLRQAEKAFSLKRERSFDLKSIGRTVTHLRIGAAGKSLGAVVGALQKDSAVRSAQPVFVYELEQKEAGDPLRERQYALQSLGVSRVHHKTTGRGISVAVLDSVIYTKHPDLAGAIVDPVDFFERARPGPLESHGTMMSGIIGARANNGVGIAGVAPDAAIIAVRVCGAIALRAREICTSDALARGLDFAIADQARVISMSLAGPYDPIVSQLVERAVGGGIVVVGATGNDGLGTVLFPAALEKVIAVTAVDRDGRIYDKANHGPRVDLAAPGVDVLTLALPQAFGTCTGTSPAAANVSGVVALLLQVRPRLSPAEVRTLLEETARDLGPPGRDDQFGWGEVDVCKALTRLTGEADFCR